jgi:hypothetical protein
MISAVRSRRPERTEYDDYYHRYISLVPDGDLIATLEREFPVTIAMLETVPAARETWSYAPGKWTFREAVGHLTDMERVFTLRALWIARDPATPLPSFEQEVWSANSNARERPLADHLEDWKAVRAASLTMIRGFTAEAMGRVGTASGLRFSVRSLVWMIPGHELHHRKVFRERYGLV